MIRDVLERVSTPAILTRRMAPGADEVLDEAEDVSTPAILTRRMAPDDRVGRRAIVEVSTPAILTRRMAPIESPDALASRAFQLPPSSRGGWRSGSTWRYCAPISFNSRHPHEEDGAAARSTACSSERRFNSRHPHEEDGASRRPSSRSGPPCFNSRHPHEEDGASSCEYARRALRVSTPAILTRRMALVYPVHGTASKVFQLPPSSRGGWRRAAPITRRSTRCFNSRHPHEEDGAPRTRACSTRSSSFNSRHPHEEDGAEFIAEDTVFADMFQLPPSSRGGWRQWTQ